MAWGPPYIPRIPVQLGTVQWRRMGGYRTMAAHWRIPYNGGVWADTVQRRRMGGGATVFFWRSTVLPVQYNGASMGGCRLWRHMALSRRLVADCRNSQSCIFSAFPDVAPGPGGGIFSFERGRNSSAFMAVVRRHLFSGFVTAWLSLVKSHLPLYGGKVGIYSATWWRSFIPVSARPKCRLDLAIWPQT
jgi:hypothetical protein